MYAPTINKNVTHVNQSVICEAHIKFGIWTVFQEPGVRIYRKKYKINNMPMPKTRRSTRHQAKENNPAVETSDNVENIVNQEKNEKTVTSSANKLR